MDIRNIKTLSSGASRLLNVLLLSGGEDLPLRSLMELAGIADKSNFYKARKELVGARLAQKQTPVTTVTTNVVTSSLISSALSSLRSDKPDQPSIDEGIYHLSSEGVAQPVELVEHGRVNITSVNATPIEEDVTPIAVNATTEVNITPIAVNATLREVNTTPTEVNITPDLAAPLSLYDRCLDADAMDSTGPESQRNTPFQKRRAVQIGLVKEAWEHFFPKAGPLTDTNAKRFLAWCENRAELVHDELEALSTRKIDNPTTYVSRVLERKAKERQYQPPSPQLISSAKPSGAYNRGDKGEPIGADELIPVSTEQLNKMKELSASYAKYFPTDY